MTDWHIHLEKENERYSEFDELDESVKNLYITVSLEGRLRKNHHLKHGSNLAQGPKDLSLMVLAGRYHGTMVYRELFTIETLEDSKFLVTSNEPTLDSYIEHYCIEVSSKYGIGIAFKSQAQSSENPHLS